MTIHEFLQHNWSPPQKDERIQGLIQVKDYVIVVTDSRLYRVQNDPFGDYTVYIVGYF
jgi:hypothetical protein